MPDQIKYTQKLQGDSVLVIGGSSGIGYGVAEALVEHGCDVSISSSQQTRVDAAVDRLRTAYPSAHARIRGFAANLADENALEAAVANLLESAAAAAPAGLLDHIVYTAGDPLAVLPLSDLSLPRIHAAGTVRFAAPLLLAKHAARNLRPGPKASIVLTSGTVAERPTPNWAVVNAYATGLQGMTRALALDLKPVRVNLVTPGIVDTQLWDHLGGDEERKRFFAPFEQKLPTGRVGQVQDVAESYLYLLRDWNITGTNVSTNGGTLLLG